MSGPVRLLPYGDRALLVELGGTEEVLRFVDALRATEPEEVSDLVPAAETVLAVAADGVPLGALREALLAVRPDDSPPAGDRAGDRARDRAGNDHAGGDHAGAVEIPVRYDGPDLADVARLTGLTEREVVEAHTGTPWRVAFGGFAPGFGYLVGGDPRLEVPRRDEARTRVPAGSVGLAGTFSGVYPRESPGGWQLIGTTTAVMWDLDRDPPALLRPGAAVRFVEEGGR
jgi:allophanate hydrolase subunit 1